MSSRPALFSDVRTEFQRLPVNSSPGRSTIVSFGHDDAPPARGHSGAGGFVRAEEAGDETGQLAAWMKSVTASARASEEPIGSASASATPLRR